MIKIKRTCFVCNKVHDDGGPTPKEYDNVKAESSCICPNCWPSVAKSVRKIVEQNKKVVIKER